MPTRAGSTPASITIAEQVLHHRMRLRDHADPPLVFVDQPRDHLGRGERLAGARRSVHREVGRVEVEQRGGDVVGDRRRCAGAVPPLTRAGCAAQQDVGRPRRRAGSAGRRRRAPRSRVDGLLQRLGVDGRTRASARTAAGRRRRRPWAASRRRRPRWALRGRRTRRLGTEPNRAPVGVVGQARRRGRVVQRVHAAVQFAVRERRRSAARAAAACGAFGGWCQSLTISAASAMKTSLLSRPLVDGIVDAVEVRPPERLVLALVKAPCGRDHRDGRLLGGCAPRRRRRRTCSSVRSRSSPMSRSAPPSRTGCGPRGGTPDSMARAISQSRSRRVDRQS